MPKPSDWIIFAEADLIAAELIIKDERALAGVFYHCQQCAEKALKAFLVHKKQTLSKTHDLEFLLEICCRLDKDFYHVLNAARDLNPFSSKTRYPEDNFIMPSLDTAYICIKQAKQILEFVNNKVK